MATIRLSVNGKTRSVDTEPERSLRVPLDRVRMVMGDTDQTPNDGGTSGSTTTPRTAPLVRRAAATARDLLLAAVGRQFGVDDARLEVRDGAV